MNRDSVKIESRKRLCSWIREKWLGLLLISNPSKQPEARRNLLSGCSVEPLPGTHPRLKLSIKGRSGSTARSSDARKGPSVYVSRAGRSRESSGGFGAD
jgi:hypothetical protein